MTQTTEKITISPEVLAHIELNAATETYRNLPGEFCKRDGKWGYFVQFDKLKEYHLTDAIKNVELIQKRVAARQKRTEILNGDIIRYKDGKEERVTYVWDDHVQAGGGSGSYYMSSYGSGSYSGSLNEGLLFSQLVLSEETKPVLFWMFSEDWAGGGRGVYFYCPVKVWQERY